MLFVSLTHTLIQQSLRASHSLDTVLGAPVKAVEEAGWDKREASFKHLAVETWVMEANEKRVSGCSHLEVEQIHSDRRWWGMAPGDTGLVRGDDDGLLS